MGNLEMGIKNAELMWLCILSANIIIQTENHRKSVVYVKTLSLYYNYRNFSASSIFTTLAGLPTTTAQSGTSLVTTDEAPMIECAPTQIPGRIVAPAPIHAPFLIRIGLHGSIIL